MSTRVLREQIVVTATLRDRFYSKCCKAESGCWIWTGAIQRNGYPAFKHGKQKHDGHVFSWRISNGGQPVPIGNLIMHLCDCRPCVNPEHLTLGTPSDNMKAAHRDGRGDDFHCRGEDRPDAILTEDMVREIRRRYCPRVCSYRQIADDLGVKEHVVRSVIIGKTWRHVE